MKYTMCAQTFSVCFLFLIALQFVWLTDNSCAGDLDFTGDISLWCDIYEESENGILRPRTQKPAADTTSGFAFKRARVEFNYEDAERLLGAKIQIRLEERPSMLDGYMAYSPYDFLHLNLGQMKVPSTYEALESDSNLDFVSRSSLSSKLTDWSLSRTPYYSAFYGNRSFNRDLGIGIKGDIGPASKPDFLSYFLMVGNGLGSNLFIGGKENKGFIFSNKFGHYFYGTRLDISPAECLTLGGHYSLNRHDNMLFNDEKTVFDLARYSWSVDFRFELQRFRVVAMYGSGKVKLPAL